MNATVLWGPARTYALMGAQARRMGQADMVQNVIQTAQASVETPEARKFMFLSPIREIAEKIHSERAWDAADFRDLTAAGAQRLSLVDAMGKAERILADAQKTWEAAHRNADELAAAQAQVEALQGQLNDANAKVTELRASVNAHSDKIAMFRDDANRRIASLPEDLQLEGRRIIDPCAAAPGMQGRRRETHRVPVTVQSQPRMAGALQLISVPIAGTRVPIYAPPRPRHLMASGSKLGQLVTVSPNVQVTVQTGIEKYLFPVGLMAAGGASFLVGTTLPSAYKVVTTLAGVGLIGWGVYILIKGGTGAGAAPPGAPATPTPPTGATSVETSPQPFVPPTVMAFNQLQSEMVSPGPDGNVSSVGTFLGIGTKKVPIVMRFYNPTKEPVTFHLAFDWDEQGSAFGYSLSPQHGSKEFQVTIGPEEQKNLDFELPIVTTGSTGQMNVGLSVSKKRVPNENKFLIMTRTFTVN